MATPTDRLSKPTPDTRATEGSFTGVQTGAQTGAQTTATRQRRRRRRITRPEQGSLYDIMREHSGTSLYVLPICWTDLHARLLKARFIEQDPVLTPMPSSKSPSRNEPRPSQTAAGLSRDLTVLLSPELTRPFCKTRAIKSVLSTLFPATMSRPKTGGELDLYFGDRVFRKAVRVPMIWKRPECTTASFDSAVTRPATSFGKIPSSSYETTGSSSWSCSTSQSTRDEPMLAYINRAQLAFVRANLFRIVAGPDNGDRSNGPVSRLQQLRSKMLVPDNVEHDAHFVGILLAMAQAHFYESRSMQPSRSSSQSSRLSLGSQKDDPTKPDFHDVTVQLITHADESAEFIVYKAVVTAAFLRRFSSPTRLPMLEALSDCGMNVEYTKVPIWPVLGLKERLGKALGREIAGDLPPDDESIETWESQEDRQARLGSFSLKRKRIDREALSEVFNQSFEVHDEDSQEAPPSGGPRLGISAPLSPTSKRRRTRPISELEVC